MCVGDTHGGSVPAVPEQWSQCCSEEISVLRDFLIVLLRSLLAGCWALCEKTPLEPVDAGTDDPDAARAAAATENDAARAPNGHDDG